MHVPFTYPAGLQEALANGVDIYYQRAAYNLPEFYPQMLPAIALSIKSGGHLAMDNRSPEAGYKDPTGVLGSAVGADNVRMPGDLPIDRLNVWEAAIGKSLTSGYGQTAKVYQKIQRGPEDAVLLRAIFSWVKDVPEYDPEDPAYMALLRDAFSQLDVIPLYDPGYPDRLVRRVSLKMMLEKNTRNKTASYDFQLEKWIALLPALAAQPPEEQPVPQDMNGQLQGGQILQTAA